MKRILLLITACVLAVSMSAQKYVGGDISMLKKFVDEGAIYKDKNNNVVEPLTLFKQAGWNSMRVRLFVDPSKASAEHRKEGAIQDLDYVKALGKQIKDAGFSLMLDFHYSDTWTDPGKHATPDAWKSLDATQLATKVYDYTKDCLQQMVDAGATPDLIQVGNEITTGMLWPAGQISNGGNTWDNLASFLGEGIKACREVCPQAQVVIHTELHNISSVYTFYSKLASYKDIQYDIIGLSYYPDFHGNMSTFGTVLTNLESRFSAKKIMIVETGYGYEYQLPGKKYDPIYSLSDAGQKKFAQDLIALLNTHSNVNGLYWWYPEYNLNGIINKNGTEDWSKNFTSGYWNAALFWPKSGYPLSALFELSSFVGESSGIGSIEVEQKGDDKWYTLDGRQLSGQATKKGIYINNQRKVVVR